MDSKIKEIDQKHGHYHNCEDMKHTCYNLHKSETEAELKPISIPNNSGYLCGIGGFYPKCLQRFATPKLYLLIFGIIGVLEGAFFTYLIGVLSTLEKRFAFGSKVSGLILVAGNLSSGVLSLVVGYYAGRWHKPRLIAFGMSMMALSCFICTLPYFIYGPAFHLLTRETTLFIQREYCGSLGNSEECEHKGNGGVSLAVIILFFANFLKGFGFIFYETVGTPYLDDNVEKKNAPMYFGAMSSLRIFGPSIGFLLSSFCLTFYEDPFYDPGIDSHNPRWVGAWWMGFFILGVTIFIFTLMLALFPRELPSKYKSETSESKEESEDTEVPKLKDFVQALKRLLKNPIFVCHTISVTFQVNGFVGYFVFIPKFMEAQYHQSASDASLFSGTPGIVSMFVGILLGGFLIKKYKPRPRYLTGYMVFVEVFSVLVLFISIFLGCDRVEMPGTTVTKEKTLNLFNDCNVDCGCTARVFEPVCGPDGISTFFSPCFAGCPNLTSPTTSAVTTAAFTTCNTMVFENCKCVTTPNTTSTFVTSNVISGFCSSGCNMLIIYVIFLCISKFISSTERVGNTLITYRCVDAKDKSFALGIIGSVMAMFGFIPYPLIYGALADSTCLVWEESCSKTGNCWLYDSDKFRYYLHGMSILLISIGICFDFVVFLLSDRLTNFYGEDDEDKSSNGKDRVARWIKEEEEEDIIFNKDDEDKSSNVEEKEERWNKNEEEEDIIFIKSVNKDPWIGMDTAM